MSKSTEQSYDQIRAATAERDRARNAERGHALIDFWLEASPDDPVAALKAALIGTPDTLRVTAKDEPPPFWSVKAQQLDLLSFLLGRLIAELEKNHLYPHWTTGGPDFDRDVARALWQLGGANLKPDLAARIPAPATAVAQVIHRFIEIARKAQNKEGGFHPPYPGALISSGHDGLKLRHAGKAAWSDFIYPLLDERTFEAMEAEELLDIAWEALSAHQLLPSLHLVFKDADSWTDYNARFGLGTLRDAVVGALERAARRAGIYAVFGTEPERTLDGVLYAIEDATKKAFPQLVRMQLQFLLASLAPVWPLGGQHTLLERKRGISAREGLIDLGVALFPEHEDMPAFGKTVPYQGRTLFQALDDELTAFASGQGVRDPLQRRDFAAAVGAFGDMFNGALADRFQALDNPPGRMGELLRQFLKLNVTHWWTEITRRAAFSSLIELLSWALRKDFSDIDPTFASTLSQFGVDAAHWQAIRESLHPEPEPPETMTSEQRGARDRVEAWVWNRLALVALDSDAAGRADAARGATDFTAEAELLRFMVQFRHLRAPFLPKPHGVLELREADRAMLQALAEGDGLPALANLLVWTALFARLRGFALDFSEGKDAGSKRDETPWFDAAMVGGLLGFCADILFGDTTGMKAVPLSAFATIDHPAVEPALDLWREARNADDVRAGLVEWAKEEGSGKRLETLQVTRQALNFALLHQLQDMMSPGFLKRAVKEMESRAAGAYWRTPDV